MGRHKKPKFELPKKENSVGDIEEPQQQQKIQAIDKEPIIVKQVEEKDVAYCCGKQMRVYCSQVHKGSRIRYWQCVDCKKTAITSNPILIREKVPYYK